MNFNFEDVSIDSSRLDILPVDSLWGRESLNIVIPAHSYQREEKTNVYYFKSAIILLLIILVLLFYRGVINSLKRLSSGFFKFKNQLALEERLSHIKERNITALISAFVITLSIAYTFGDYLYDTMEIKEGYMLGIPLLFMALYWVFKSLLLQFAAWLTKEKTAFYIIGKVGYNHFIAAAVITLPIIFHPFIQNIVSHQFLLNYLIIGYSTIIIFYFIRVGQTIISHHFSHFFYILYLCTVEILPIALLINYTLSYN